VGGGRLLGRARGGWLGGWNSIHVGEWRSAHDVYILPLNDHINGFTGGNIAVVINMLGPTQINSDLQRMSV